MYCRQEGVIRVDNLGGYVCREHFYRYFYKRVRRVLRKAGKGKKMLIAVSGGKDSVTALHALSKLRDEFKLELGALLIDLGFQVDINLENFLYKLAETYEAKPYFVSLKEEIGTTIPELNRRDACKVCGLVKRHIFNRVAYENGYDYLVTGHNLSDIGYFAINNLITHNLYFFKYLDSVIKPVPGLKMVGRVRPLFWLTDQDTSNYVRVEGIKIVDFKCPYSETDKQRFIKPFLESILEKWPNSLKNLVSSTRYLAFNDNVEAIGIPTRACKICGYPSRYDICSYCRLKLKHKKSLQVNE